MPRGSTSLILLLAACGGTAPRDPDVVTRDSAGIAIIESSQPAWGTATPWVVDASPILTIGSADGEEPYLLHGVTGAVRLDDGSIVVLDLSRELRQFDSTGTFMRAAGRPGPGPGEFDGVSRMGRCGTGALWVGTPSRLSIWGSDLHFRREFRLPKRAMSPIICFGGAGLVVQQGTGSDMDAQPPNQIVTDSLDLFLVDSLGLHEQHFQRIPLKGRVLVHLDGGGVSFLHPLGHTAALAPAGSLMAVTDGRSFAIRSYGSDGALRRIVRGPIEPLALTDSMRQRYFAARLGGPARQEREWLARAGNPMPDATPAYEALIADADGFLWARRFTIPGDDMQRWGVFGPDGPFLGYVALPAGLDVLEIGADYVLGKVQDSLGVERVLEFRLNKQ